MGPKGIEPLSNGLEPFILPLNHGPRASSRVYFPQQVGSRVYKIIRKILFFNVSYKKLDSKILFLSVSRTK